MNNNALRHLNLMCLEGWWDLNILSSSFSVEIPGMGHIPILRLSFPIRVQLETITGKTSPSCHMLLTVATHLTLLVTPSTQWTVSWNH